MSIIRGFAPSTAFQQGSKEYFNAKRQERTWSLFTGEAPLPAGWLFTELDATERRIAVSVGKERNRRAVADGRKDNFTENCADPEAVHILGACGEAAFAKATARYWNMGIDTFQNVGDVGIFEIRTRSSCSYDLKVRYDEPLGRYCVLVFGCLDWRDIGAKCSDKREGLEQTVDEEAELFGEPLPPLPCFRFFVAGYMLSDNAKQDKYKSTLPGFEKTYLIPQQDLQSAELLIVRDWIAHYNLERKAPRPRFRSYNDYTGGDYYPKEETIVQAELTELVDRLAA